MSAQATMSKPSMFPGASAEGQAVRAAQKTIAVNPLLGIRAADLKLAAGPARSVEEFLERKAGVTS
jgi:hypothetical protein